MASKYKKAEYWEWLWAWTYGEDLDFPQSKVQQIAHMRYIKNKRRRKGKDPNKLLQQLENHLEKKK